MKTTYILGAGASIAESEYRCYREGENAISFPSLKNFFKTARKLDNVILKHKRMFKYLFEDWGISYSDLENAKYNMEELLSVFDYIVNNKEIKLIDKIREGLFYSEFTNFIVDVIYELQNINNVQNPILHNKLANKLRREDCVINFNYDLIMDYALCNICKDINQVEMYNMNFESYFRNIEWIKKDSKVANDIKYFKLHGSINWFKSTGFISESRDIKAKIDYNEKLKDRYYLIPANEFKNQFNEDIGDDMFELDNHKVLFQREIIPPIINKKINILLWESAKKQLKESNTIVIIGYSMPVTDFDVLNLFQNIKRTGERDSVSLIVIDKDESVRRKYESILKRPAKYYLSFEKYLNESNESSFG